METVKSRDGSVLVGFNKRLGAKDVKDYMQREKISGMYVHDVLDPIEDLGVELAAYSFLEHLSIQTVKDHDWSFLEGFKGLQTLSIRTPGKHVIDLSQLGELKKLSLVWRPKVRGLASLKHLEELWLMDYKEMDLEPIHSLDSINSLLIHTATIHSLHGIAHFQALQYLELGNCRSLRSVQAINGLPRLNRLHFDACTRVEDFDEVTHLPCLETFILMNCKDIPSIGFVRHFKALKYISLTGNTHVMDGDLRFLSSIEKSYFSPRKHYKV